MKKNYLLFPIFVLTLFTYSIVFAEVSTTSQNKSIEARKEMVDQKQKALEERAEVKAKIASTTERLKEKREELKSAAELRIGKKLEERKAKIAEAFEKALENLKSLIEKTGSRISKMEAESINVAEAKLLLETAKAKFAIAETGLTNLENLLTNDVPANSTGTERNAERKNILRSLNTQSEKTKAAIKATHKATVDVINSLKRGLMKNKNSSSTKQEVSTTTNI